MANYLHPELPILLVDDEDIALEGYEWVLTSNGMNNHRSCSDSRTVEGILATHPVSLILLDLVMPHVNGEELLEKIQEDYPHIPIIVVTGVSDVSTAVRCMQKGAYDYLLKPIDENRLITAVKRAIEYGEMKRELNDIRSEMMTPDLQAPEHFEAIITQDRQMFDIFRYVEAVAPSSQAVLITGETGAGKEGIARSVHLASSSTGSYEAVNVAGLDDTMFSDVLFGHEKGAFTGAAAHRKGLVEQTSGGTLFLDEIGDLRMENQVKLLRLLQEKEYYQLGSDKVKRSNTRFVFSTNRDIEALVNSGEFRKDLFYRLSSHRISLPPLRKRKNDIGLLVNHFMREASEDLDKPIPTYPPELIPMLKTYLFPGNVRELRAMVFEAVAKHKGRMLSTSVFRHMMKEGDEQLLTTEDSGDLLPENPFQKMEVLPSEEQSLQMLIQEALERAEGNRSLAARMLGMTRQKLTRHLPEA